MRTQPICRAAVRGAQLVMVVVALSCVELGAAEAQVGAGNPLGSRGSIGRVLGVFDAELGSAIVGAEVVDLVTGTFATTSETGTVTLAFLPEGVTLVRVRKLGFEPTTFPVAIGPGDTTSITVILHRVAQQLPSVVSLQRNSPDTIRKLIDNGFYARRSSSGAPPEAFVSGPQLTNAHTLADLAKAAGRALCTNNIYVDGFRADTAPRNRPTSTSARRVTRAGGIDSSIVPKVANTNSVLQGLTPESVLGIETYRGSEIPPQYNNSQMTGSATACATLIWTK